MSSAPIESPGNALTAPVQTGAPTTAVQVAGPRLSLRSSFNAAYMETLLEEKQAMALLIQDYLEERLDYGTIKGTTKPTLYKAGAEKVTQAYDCQAVFDIIEHEADHDRVVIFVKKGGNKQAGETLGLYRYVIRCRLIHRASQQVVAEGYGACSTMESKYIDRPRDCENTALKMAKKRAHVDAVLGGFGLSERFTQDMEDGMQGVGEVSAEQQVSTPAEGSVEWAKAYPLPGDKTAWGGKGGTPLGELSVKMLQRVQAWAETQLEKQPDHRGATRLKKAAEVLIMDAADKLADAAEAKSTAPALDDAPYGATSPAAAAPAAEAPAAPAAEAPQPAKAAPPPNDLQAHAPALEGLPSPLMDEDDDLPF